MARTQWSDWRQVAETFVAERPSPAAARNVEALVILLRRVGSWTDFLGGGWVLMASRELFMSDFEGFSNARAHQLLDRVVTWLRGRGDLDDWQRDVLHTKIDEARSAYGRPTRRARHVTEYRCAPHDREALARELDEAVADLGLGGRFVVDLLVRQVTAQHGPSEAPPMGALDPDRVVADVLEGATNASDRLAACALLTGCARLYGRLATSGRLEAARGRALAERFARAALCVGPLALATTTAEDAA
ncbi:MAG: hypothetical protein KF729_08350 [Sandaracinaceae bacterium]|nr:hypothetical protein [Sandaracinaceae bacterium]